MFQVLVALVVVAVLGYYFLMDTVTFRGVPTNPSLSSSSTMASATPIRTFKIRIADSEIEAALGDCYTHFVLALPYEPKFDDNASPLEQSPLITILSTISHDMPFVPSKGGKLRFCMKTYSENEGLLEQLSKLGVLQKAPGVNELQNGPIVEVLSNEREISHGCLKCAREGISEVKFELKDAPRLLKCSGCSLVYYCNKECQTADWKTHKAECKAKLWRLDTRAEAARRMENARRAEMSDFLSQAGFMTVNI